MLREALALDVPSLARARRDVFNEEVAEAMVALNEPRKSVLVDLPDSRRRYRGLDHDASWMPGDSRPMKLLRRELDPLDHNYVILSEPRLLPRLPRP